MTAAQQAAFRLACDLPSRVVPARSYEPTKPRLGIGRPRKSTTDQAIERMKRLRREGMSYERIGEIMRLSEATVLRRLLEKR